MIYCNLKGGLGNMLFQIAATLSMAKDNEQECSFPNLIPHLYYLNDDNTYNPSLKHSLEYLKMLNKLNNFNYPSDKQISIVTFPFEYVDFTTPKKDILIDGFFQSEKYFKKNRDLIIEYFSIPKEFYELIQKKYANILTKNLTSIHVRRGDYTNHQEFHPTQTLNYYLESIDYLKDKTDLYIVFSDDINWCKNNIKRENIIYIEDEKDYIELYLMSLCDNNIISNSSFSWWGAWLNNNNNKIVIAPKKWFGEGLKHKTEDIIPEGWVKI